MIRATMFKWPVVAFTLFIVVAIVVLGPEITSEMEKGDFCALSSFSMTCSDANNPLDGVAGEWCYITDGYLPERVAYVCRLSFIASC